MCFFGKQKEMEFRDHFGVKNGLLPLCAGSEEVMNFCHAIFCAMCVTVEEH